MRFLSRFNFPSRIRPPELWPAAVPWIQAARLSPWLLPVAIAVAAHGLWLAGSSVVERPRRPTPVPRAADNSPELVRYSSQASQAGSLATGLGTLTLPFESSLPLPPPELLGSAPPPPPAAAGDQGRAQQQPTLRSRPVALAPRQAGTGLAWGVDQSLPRGLPGDAATALGLAGQLDAGAEPSGESGPGEKDDASRLARKALAARHLRLTTASDRPYRILWDSGSAAASRPEDLANLPEGVEVRRLPLAAARAMGLSQPHGISVASPAGLLLLWVKGDELWLIRRSPPAAADPA